MIEIIRGDEPARYLAIGRLCLEPGWRVIEDGAEFEHPGPPSNGMLALNASARKAKLASISPRWREARPHHLRRVAGSLGGLPRDATDAEVVSQGQTNQEMPRGFQHSESRSAWHSQKYRVPVDQLNAEKRAT